MERQNAADETHSKVTKFSKVSVFYTIILFEHFCTEISNNSVVVLHAERAVSWCKYKCIATVF